MPRASLKQRKDGRYVVVYKGKQLYGATQAEAFRARDAYRRQLEAGLRAETAGVTLLEYAASWVHTYKKNVTNRTYFDYVRYLNSFVACVGDMRLKDVVPSDIKRAYNSLAGYSRSYVSTYAQLVSGMFASAVADRIITSNPCASVNPPRASAGSHRAIEEWERALILKSCHRFTPAALLMLCAGLRRGEALALNVSRDVDFQAMTVSVSEAVRFDSNAPVLSDPKTEAGARVVPLLNVLAAALRPIRGLAAPSPSGGYMSETAVKKSWKSYLSHLEELLNGDTRRWYGRRAGQPPDYRVLHPWRSVHIQMHDLRHTFCTMLYDSGVDLKTAMKWMGHADQSLTLRIYTHLTAEKELSSSAKFLKSLNSHIQNDIQPAPPPSQSKAL